MESLRKKIQDGISEDEKADILIRLLSRIEDNQGIGADPEEIMLGEDNEITIECVREGINLAFLPPEVISAFASDSGAPSIGEPQACFLLGMIAYFMARGADYYSVRGLWALELARNPDGRRYVIPPEEVADIPYGNAISALTAVESGERARGLRDLRSYITSNMPERARIRYWCDGQLVETEERELRNDIENLLNGESVTFHGVAYSAASSGPVRIPYRPGTRQYDVRLRRAEHAGVGLCRRLFIRKAYLTGRNADFEHFMPFLELRDNASKELSLKMSYPSCELSLFESREGENGRFRLIKRYVIPKPVNSGLSDYTLRFAYLAQRGLVQVRITGDGGAEIAPPVSLQM
ncbi:MAG: hypothetical protein IJQ81_09720 [Oscillibacter sp.]|nr:hypothetical protein [Oscillibacter sp.]